MATNGKVKRIDLDHLIQEFTLWQKNLQKKGSEVSIKTRSTPASLSFTCQTLRDSVHENNCLQMEIRSLLKKVQSSEEAEKIAREEAGRFKDMVDKLQEVISKRCDYEDQNEELRKQIAGMKDKSSKIEEEHEKQISEALKNLETADQVHKEEVLRVKKETLQQNRGEIDTLKKSLKESADEVQQLQKQLAEVNRANHTEIVKLQLEYDAKLQKLQRNCVRTQSGQASNVNNDIFRKKLQFAKAEAQKEIAALKSKVSELERKLSLQQMSAAKRKRF